MDQKKASKRKSRGEKSSASIATKKRKKDPELEAGDEQIFEHAKSLAKKNKIKRLLLFHREVECITKDDDLPLPSEEQGKAFLVGIVGRRKSGKTFYLDQMMKTFWRKEFDKIYVLSKTAKYQSYFQTWKGNIKYIDEWSKDFFDKVKEEQTQNKDKRVLIIIDDMSSDMREKLYATNIDEFSFIGRHFRVSVVWLAQKITLFTPGFRQEVDAFFLFREENMQELRLLHREWGFGEMDEFINLIVENTEEDHSLIMIRNIKGKITIYRFPTEEEMQEILCQGSGANAATQKETKAPRPTSTRKARKSGKELPGSK